MFLYIMFLVYSSYILDIVLFDDLHLHMFVDYQIQFVRELGSFDNVSVVLRYEIPCECRLCTRTCGRSLR
jgi:hypothetical protein